MKQIKAAGAVLLATGGMAFADGHADQVNLQLQWVTQAQFAGYYVALENGYYDEEGLAVNILPGGPDIAPPQVLAGGGADVMLNWMPSALAAARARFAGGEHRAALRAVGSDADLLGRQRRGGACRSGRQDRGALVLRQ